MAQAQRLSKGGSFWILGFGQKCSPTPKAPPLNLQLVKPTKALAALPSYSGASLKCLARSNLSPGDRSEAVMAATVGRQASIERATNNIEKRTSVENAFLHHWCKAPGLRL